MRLSYKNVFVLFMSIYVLISIYFHGDYGITVDDPVHLYILETTLDFLDGKIKCRDVLNSNDPNLNYGMFLMYVGKIFSKLSGENISYGKTFFFRLPILIFSFASIISVFITTKIVLSDEKPAFFSSLVLSLYPTFMFLMHIDFKDLFLSESIFISYMFLILSFIKKRKTYLIISSLYLAVSLSVKPSGILFILSTIISLFIIILGNRKNSIDLSFIVLWFFVAAILYNIFYPFSVCNPVLVNIKRARYFSTYNPGIPILYFGKIEYSNHAPLFYAFTMFMLKTPVLFILFFLIGFVFILKKEGYDNEFERLHTYIILLWFILPLLFFSFGRDCYNNIRQFVQIIFPFSMVTGLGISRFLEKLPNKMIRVLLIVYFVIYSLYLYSLHPIEDGFFNFATSFFVSPSREFQYDTSGSSYIYFISNSRVRDICFREKCFALTSIFDIYRSFGIDYISLDSFNKKLRSGDDIGILVICEPDTCAYGFDEICKSDIGYVINNGVRSEYDVNFIMTLKDRIVCALLKFS